MAQAVMTDQQLIEQMEIKLSHLAMQWRAQKDQANADSIVRQYQSMLRCMIDLGFDEELYVDSELPDELMPQEYLDLFDA